MKEALAQVRRDLGGNAVILGTREVRTRRLFGLGTREQVEVMASDGPEAGSASLARIVTPNFAAPSRMILPTKFGEQLRELHAMVETLSNQGRIEQFLPEIPSDLVPSYARLLESDVPETLARRLVRQVAETLESSERTGPEAIDDALVDAVEEALPIAPPIAIIAGTRRIVALVGPTGVGKTTTVAKLAANFKLAQGYRPGLITVDTYRIAAVEQLRTYAEIIDLPLVVANSPGEMARALNDLGDLDVVLIDTAGRSPRDEVKIRELADFLDEARPDETHLVLSANSSEKSLRGAVDRFAAVRADRLILTKLDEAESLGGLLSILNLAERPVSYLTTGQAVPDDIEPADRGRLARLILGQEGIL